MDPGALLGPRLPVALALTLAIAVAASLPQLRRLSAIAAPGITRFRDSALDRNSLLWRDFAAVVLVAAFLLVTFSAGNYGYNVDESFQTTHAAALFEWYGELLTRGNFTEFHAEVDAMKHYGGGFELLAEIASRASPFHPIDTRHILTAWTALLGLVAAYLLGCLLSSRAAGFLAILILLLTPRFYGHFFSNPKDIPFAVGMLFALLAICRTLQSLPTPSPARIATVGFAIGAAATVRVGGLIALLYFCMALAWSLGGSLLLQRKERAGRPLHDVIRLSTAGVSVLALSWAVMLLFWPWAMHEPILRPFQALGYFQDIVAQQQIDFTVFFEGDYTRLSQIPRYFTLKFLLLSMPEFALLSPLLAYPAFRLLQKRGLPWPNARGMAWLLCATSVVLPLAMTAGDGLIQYDGIRHFLFVVPPIAVLFSAALVESLCTDISSRFKAGLASGVLALALLTAVDTQRLHPYEYTYFNRSIAGGLQKAARSYETDYLGLSYRDGFQWLLANYQPRHNGPIRISGCQGFHVNLVDAHARAGPGAERFRPVRPTQNPEVALAATRSRCHESYRGQLLSTVEREGVPLLYIFKLR